MKIFTAWILCLSVLAGCATLDSALSTRGVIDETISKMSRTRIVTMSPVLSKSGLTDIQAELGLYWDEAKGDNALFIVQLDGAKNFDPEKAFEIKVDGELIKLQAANSGDYGDIETNYGSKYVYAHNVSRKSYVIKKVQILKIANGKEAYYRIWFMKDTFAEGEISYQYQQFQTYVPYSFKRFYAQVWK